ncbi:MAG: pyruvate/2-oxoglutarate dehydrogenase complex dihydrolipoamide dehydrogenase (E3) component, partial [Chlamydiales bacterium]
MWDITQGFPIMPKQHYPIVVLGAGAAGLVVAIGAAKAGKRVLLIEKGNYGGDCTHFGCVPSKALIASAHASHAIHSGKKYGIDIQSNSFSADRALQRTRDIVASFVSHENPKALKDLGVNTITGIASFTSPKNIIVTDEEGKEDAISGDHIVIATGSHPFIPDIEGLDTVPFLTNENIFDLKAIPESLAIIGAGAIGCELGQAFQRLGAKVTVVEFLDSLIFREEPEAQEILKSSFNNEGITTILNHETVKVEKIENKISLTLRNRNDKKEHVIQVSHLLVAVGRRPNLKSLDLEKAKVQHSPKGITIDSYGRSSQKHIWAAGDVTGEALFTHMAENRARTILTNILLPWPLRIKLDLKQAVPRVTFTDPEVASIGITEKEAIDTYKKQSLA